VTHSDRSGNPGVPRPAESAALRQAALAVSQAFEDSKKK